MFRAKLGSPLGEQYGWRPRKQLAGLGIPAKLRPWLMEPRSLSLRLRRACPGRFHLRVHSERWQRPLHDEARALAMPPYEHGFVRHVLLLCRDTPCVFARSIIPPRTLQQTGRRLAALGARPLGRILFSDRTLQRVQVHVCEIEPEHPLFRLAASSLGRQPGAAWARRSLFLLRNCPLLVNEVFLPEAFDG